MAPRATHTNAAHLLRRAGWGGRPDEIQAAVDDGIDATVERLLDPTNAPIVGEPRRRPGVDAFEFDALQAWFVRLAATSPTPAIERLTWFWSGHFASSIDKVEFPDLLHRQYVTSRHHSLGRFDRLLQEISRDAAMNLMLDLHLSVVGSPNENFARELMELFSLGASNGYTQQDVVEVARAFTGYSLRHTNGRIIGAELRPATHDFGDKTVLGVTGPHDGDDVIALIAERRECREFVVRRFWRRYAGTAPALELVQRLAADFGRDLRIDTLLRSMWTLDEFYTAEVRGGLVGQPLETLVRTIRGFEMELVDAESVVWDDDEDDDVRFLPRWMVPDLLFAMGQRLGQPPNVAGWPHNDAWLDSNRAAGRLQAGIQLGRWLGDADTAVAEQLRQIADRPSDLAAQLLRRLGVVDISDDSADAIAAAATGRPAPDAVAAAFAVAFTSPEVTIT